MPGCLSRKMPKNPPMAKKVPAPPPPPKRARGQPSPYRPEFAKQAKDRCEKGADNKELAEFFDVSLTTLDRWAAKHTEFRGALKVGKEPADDRVERSLFQRAVGYSFESEKIFQYEGRAVRVKTIEHVPPDVTAQIFWLKNRRPKEWRDRRDLVVEESPETVARRERAREALFRLMDDIAAAKHAGQPVQIESTAVPVKRKNGSGE